MAFMSENNAKQILINAIKVAQQAGASPSTADPNIRIQLNGNVQDIKKALAALPFGQNGFVIRTQGEAIVIELRNVQERGSWAQKINFLGEIFGRDIFPQLNTMRSDIGSAIAQAIENRRDHLSDGDNEEDDEEQDVWDDIAQNPQIPELELDLDNAKYDNQTNSFLIPCSEADEESLNRLNRNGYIYRQANRQRYIEIPQEYVNDIVFLNNVQKERLTPVLPQIQPQPIQPQQSENNNLQAIDLAAAFSDPDDADYFYIPFQNELTNVRQRQIQNALGGTPLVGLDIVNNAYHLKIQKSQIQQLGILSNEQKRQLEERFPIQAHQDVAAQGNPPAPNNAADVNNNVPQPPPIPVVEPPVLPQQNNVQNNNLNAANNVGNSNPPPIPNTPPPVMRDDIGNGNPPPMPNTPPPVLPQQNNVPVNFARSQAPLLDRQLYENYAQYVPIAPTIDQGPGHFSFTLNPNEVAADVVAKNNFAVNLGRRLGCDARYDQENNRITLIGDPATLVRQLNELIDNKELRQANERINPFEEFQQPHNQLDEDTENNDVPLVNNNLPNPDVPPVIHNTNQNNNAPVIPQNRAVHRLDLNAAVEFPDDTDYIYVPCPAFLAGRIINDINENRGLPAQIWMAEYKDDIRYLKIRKDALNLVPFTEEQKQALLNNPNALHLPADQINALQGNPLANNNNLNPNNNNNLNPNNNNPLRDQIEFRRADRNGDNAPLDEVNARKRAFEQWLAPKKRDEQYIAKADAIWADDWVTQDPNNPGANRVEQNNPNARKVTLPNNGGAFTYNAATHAVQAVDINSDNKPALFGAMVGALKAADPQALKGIVALKLDETVSLADAAIAFEAALRQGLIPCCMAANPNSPNTGIPQQEILDALSPEVRRLYNERKAALDDPNNPNPPAAAHRERLRIAEDRPARQPQQRQQQEPPQPNNPNPQVRYGMRLNEASYENQNFVIPFDNTQRAELQLAINSPPHVGGHYAIIENPTRLMISSVDDSLDRINFLSAEQKTELRQLQQAQQQNNNLLNNENNRRLQPRQLERQLQNVGLNVAKASYNSKSGWYTIPCASGNHASMSQLQRTLMQMGINARIEPGRSHTAPYYLVMDSRQVTLLPLETKQREHLQRISQQSLLQQDQRRNQNHGQPQPGNQPENPPENPPSNAPGL